MPFIYIYIYIKYIYIFSVVPSFSFSTFVHDFFSWFVLFFPFLSPASFLLRRLSIRLAGSSSFAVLISLTSPGPGGEYLRRSTYLTLAWSLFGRKAVIVRPNQREFECVFLASRYMTEWAPQHPRRRRLGQYDSYTQGGEPTARTRWGAKRQGGTSKRICAGRRRSRGKIVASKDVSEAAELRSPFWHVTIFSSKVSFPFFLYSLSLPLCGEECCFFFFLFTSPLEGKLLRLIEREEISLTPCLINYFSENVPVLTILFYSKSVHVLIKEKSKIFFFFV